MFLTFDQLPIDIQNDIINEYLELPEYIEPWEYTRAIYTTKTHYFSLEDEIEMAHIKTTH